MQRSFSYTILLLLVYIAIACDSTPLSFRTTKPTNAAPGTPVLLARLEEKTIDESSGIVASRSTPGVFWTHNDSGDGPFIYAFDRAGRRRGVWSIQGASAYDWEDIACGPGPEQEHTYLYIGDIGDNKYARAQIVIYRIPEPAVEPSDARSSRKDPRLTAPAETILLKYPDGPNDAEALMVHPVTGDIYIITKTAAAGVYKLKVPPSTTEVNMLVRIADLSIPSVFGNLITGGDISPDGRRVALSDYAHGYELRLPNSSNIEFDAIWQQPPTVISLGERQQGDSICYRLDGLALLATSEGSQAALYEVVIPNL